MIRKIWKFLTTYGVEDETLAEITHDIIGENLKYAKFFLASCCLGLVIGMFSPLLVEHNTVKALIFLATTIHFLTLHHIARRMQKNPGTTLKQTEVIVIFAMLGVILEQIYIGSVSNPDRPAVLYHAILMYTMSMFVAKPIVSVSIPIFAIGGLFAADFVFKSSQQLLEDMINGSLSTCMAVIGSIYTTRREIKRYILKTQSVEHMAQLEQKSRLALDSLNSMEKSDEALAVAQHDELHHLRILSALCKENEPEKAAVYADSLISELESIPPIRFTENALINAILTVQAGKAQEGKVRFQAEAIVPERVPIADKDLCTVFMNLIENAVEAAAKTRLEQKRFVNINIHIEDGCLQIVIKNSLPENFDMEAFKADMGKSTKTDARRHGIGMKSAAAVLALYDGELRYTFQSDTLTLNTGMWIG